MESIMAIVKGKAEARRGIGNYQKHITELLKKYYNIIKIHIFKNFYMS